MPHPVGGAMGVALCTAVEIKGDKPASYQIFIRQLRAGICLAIVL